MAEFMDFKEIHRLQKEPLDYKISTAITAIKAGFAVCKNRTALAFSGGKDSTVLWHLIRENFPKESENMAVIFGNTGVEYPESLKFARQLGKEWGGENFHEATPAKTTKDSPKYDAQKEILKWLIETNQLDKILKSDGKLKSTETLERAATPEMWEDFRNRGLVWKAGTVKNYWWCADQYGFPILGKAASKLYARRINIDCFLKFSATKSEKADLQKYYDVLKEVKISQMCCNVLKKEPSERVQAEWGIDVIFKGLLAAESHNRKTNFAKRGYLFESSRKYLETPFYHCNPISLWTDEDIWEYIHRYNVPYSPLYDLKYVNQAGEVCKMQRNGCIGCFTDYGRKDSHMYVLRQTHPKAWEVVMKNGLAEEIQKLRQNKHYRPNKKNYNRLAVLDVANDEDTLNWLLETRPCAFD